MRRRCGKKLWIEGCSDCGSYSHKEKSTHLKLRLGSLSHKPIKEISVLDLLAAMAIIFVKTTIVRCKSGDIRIGNSISTFTVLDELRKL